MNELTNIEKWLEKSGSNEILGDSGHRYKLRRALLRSQEFEINRVSFERWERLWSFTGAVVAGSAVAVVIVISVTTVVSPSAKLAESPSFDVIQVAEAEEKAGEDEPHITWTDFENMMDGAHAALASVK